MIGVILASLVSKVIGQQRIENWASHIAIAIDVDIVNKAGKSERDG